MSELVHFKGVIDGISRDRRAAVVKLDQSVEDVDFAIVTPDTEGRLELMNGRGAFKLGEKVGGEGRLGPDAIIASMVHTLEPAH